MLVQWSYFWTSKQLFSKIQIFSTYDFGFFQQFLSFEKLETWLASAFLSKVMSSHGRKFMLMVTGPSLCRLQEKKEMLTEFSKLQSCSVKSFFISNWCWAQTAQLSQQIRSRKWSGAVLLPADGVKTWKAWLCHLSQFCLPGWNLLTKLILYGKRINYVICTRDSTAKY